MRPELFVIPGINISIKSYGFMMVLGFLSAVALGRYLARRRGENPDNITNFGLYALLSGVIGARLFYVFHDWKYFAENPMQVFAIWSGGLEFLGGVLAATAVLIWYFRRRRLSIFKYLDIIAPALMLGLAFGRIGCFLNGCCFGAPSGLPWAIEFPAVNEYAVKGGMEPRYSYPWDYQLRVDHTRREAPLLELPGEYYQGLDEQGSPVPVPPGMLTAEQREKLEDGTFHMHPVHPAQIYSSLGAVTLAVILLGFTLSKFHRREGQTFALLLILYGLMRFYFEGLRNSSPLEFGLFTISQILAMIMVPAGIIVMVYLGKRGQVAEAMGSVKMISSRTDNPKVPNLKTKTAKK